MKSRLVRAQGGIAQFALFLADKISFPQNSLAHRIGTPTRPYNLRMTLETASMGSRRTELPSKAALPFKTANKHKRQVLFIKQKRARDAAKRDERFRRKREEDKDSSLKEERLRQNV